MDESIKMSICSTLNEYLFRNIWNEPDTEFRRTTTPFLLQTRSATGAFRAGSQSHTLPVGGIPYYIYALADTALGSFSFDISDWITFAELANTMGVVWNLHGDNGQMLHKSYVYVKHDPTTKYLYIAVHKQMAQTVLGISYHVRNIYSSQYIYNHNYNKPTIFSSRAPTDAVELINFRRQVKQKILATNYSILYVNGYERDVINIDNIAINDYVDVVADPEVFCMFELDLSDVSQYEVFYSDKDSLNKVLIHIPRALNPNNWVLTPNTIDIHIRGKEIGTQPIQDGLYIHRHQVSVGIGNVTHNDFSIPLYILEAYRDTLGVSDTVLRIRCRRHHNDNVLIPDKSYINLLYSTRHTDSDIIDLLMGRGEEDLSFWKASELEQSGYIDTLLDVPNIITPSLMTDYVDTLGYYHTISLVAQRVQHVVLGDWFDGTVILNKPKIFEKRKVSPLVFIEGRKVPFHKVTIVDNGETQFSITLDETVSYNIGDKMLVEIFLDGNENSYLFTPTEEDHTLIIEYEDFAVFEQLDASSTEDIKGINTTSDVVYEELETLVSYVAYNLVEGGMELTFAPSLYNRTFLIQDKEFTRLYSKNIDSDLINTDVVAITLDILTTDEINRTPIMTFNGVKAFLNNKTLIEGIDFHIANFTDPNGKVAIRQAILTNVKYLNTSNNLFEVVVFGEVIEDMDSGFFIKDHIQTNDPATLWYPPISTLYVDGHIIHDVVPIGNGYQIDTTDIRVGAPFGLMTCVPKCVKDFINYYHSNDDRDRLVILNEYFNDYVQDVESVVITESHNIVSIMCVAVCKDIKNNTADLGYDPDGTFQNLDLAEYEYLRSHDIAISTDMDFDFIDVLPTYVQLTVTPTQYALIQRVRQVLIPDDQVADGD